MLRNFTGRHSSVISNHLINSGDSCIGAGSMDLLGKGASLNVCMPCLNSCTSFTQMYDLSSVHHKHFIRQNMPAFVSPLATKKHTSHLCSTLDRFIMFTLCFRRQLYTHNFYQTTQFCLMRHKPKLNAKIKWKKPVWQL